MDAENQDQSEAVVQKDAPNLLNSPKFESVDQHTELYSLKNDQTPKVRKPYTITKQREKWTEEEHQKFLEALKLYGRGWRQIEEHVGTKTAVQIRSHAQKFFSKVVRETNGGSESCAKPIEIPPPRPKRKPMHPYPRKLADTLKGGSPATQTERSKALYESTGEQENKSPTSVLSPYGSDTVSAASEQQNRCSSPTSCTTNMQSMLASPVEKANEYATSKATVEEEKKFYAGVKDNACANQVQNEVYPSTRIKLFGQTVLVDSCKHSSSIIKNNHENIEGDDGTVVTTSTSNHVETNLSPGMFMGNCLAAAGATTNPCFKFFTEKSDLMEPVPDASHPCWVIYNGLPYYLSPADSNIVHAPERCNGEKEISTERSCTGSNAGSVTQTENKERNSDSADSQFQHPALEAALETRPRNGKGFVPYKRCLAERDVSSIVVAHEEQGRRRARVCS